MSKRRPLTFLLVGLVNTLLDFFFYTLLVFAMSPSAKDIWIVGILSGIFALTAAYLTHRYITWRDQRASKKTVVKFFLATGFGLWVIRPTLLVLFMTLSPVYSIAYTLLQPLGFSLDFITSTGAFILSATLVIIYNFFVYDRFVFTSDSRTAQGTDSRF